MPPLLYLLAACNLVIGTGAFVIAGILAPVAQALHVSVPAAGQAMTAYALATAVLAPVLLMATGHWRRKHALLLALGLFTLGNLVCALAASLPVLLAGRVLMGLGALFTPIAAGIAIAAVAPQRRGAALSLVFLGMSLSYAIGVPLGAWLGLKYGWAFPVGAVAAVSALAMAVVAWRVPAGVDSPGARFAGLGALLARAEVAWALGLTLLYFVAIFVVFSYIGPVLQALRPMAPETFSLVLALFGLSGAVGTVVGGWANDRFGWHRTLVVQLSALATCMALLPLAAGQLAAMVGLLLAWGVAGFGMMTPQQSRLAALAPAQAPLLMSLNSSMLYVGTAIGAAVGGALAGRMGFGLLPWVGVPFALAGLASLWISRPPIGLTPVPGTR